MTSTRTRSSGWLTMVLGLGSFVIGLYEIIGSPDADALRSWLGIPVALGSCSFLSAVVLVLRRLYTPVHWGKPSKASLILLGAYLTVAGAFIVLTLYGTARQDRLVCQAALWAWIGVGGISMGVLVLRDDRGVILPRPIPKSKSGLKALGGLEQPEGMARTGDLWSQTLMDEERSTADDPGALNQVRQKDL